MLATPQAQTRQILNCCHSSALRFPESLKFVQGLHRQLSALSPFRMVKYVNLPMLGLLSFCVILFVGTTEALQTKSVDWKDIPGRPLQSHVRKGIKFDQLLPRMSTPDEKSPPEAHRRVDFDFRLPGLNSTGFPDELLPERIPIELDDNLLVSFLIVVTRSNRSSVLVSIRTLWPEAFIQYIPHDSYVVVVPEDIAHEIDQIEGAEATFILPPELKISPAMLEEVYGIDAEQTINSFASLKTNQREELTASEDDGSPRECMNKPPQLSSGKSGRRADLDTAAGVLSVSVARGNAESFRDHWRAGLGRAGLDSAVESIYDSGGSGHVTVVVNGSSGDVGSVAGWLAQQGPVLWVERKAAITAFKIERVEAQTKPEQLRNIDTVSSIAGDRYGINDEPLLWFHGLRGDSQVLAVADSGLDYDNCAFGSGNATADAAQISFCHNFETCANPGVHRKVYSYRTFFDNTVGDYVNGHGTHVTGSACADVEDPSNPFQLHGIAPGAKVAFEDGQPVPTTPEEERALNLPFPPRNLFINSQQAGIKVHSNSWGFSGVTAYEVAAQDVDVEMHNNDDFLVIFSAGNDGRMGYQTVSSPAVSKNAISVGASENLDSAVPLQARATFLQITEAVTLQGFFIPVAFADFGDSPDFANISGRLVQIVSAADDDSSTGCSAVTNAAELAGNIALIRRGDCTVQSKCRNAENAGATACIIANNQAGDPTIIRPGLDDGAVPVTIPSMGVSTAAGDALQSLLGGGTVSILLPLFDSLSPENVADFSARGPTTDMRLKPDIVAIGQDVLSARGDSDLTSEQCTDSTAAVFNSGTSMSCPMVAGAAVLVREYFERGYFQTGKAMASAGFSPSAALVKAVILHSGEQMSFPKQTRNPFSTNEDLFPNFDQGHGRLNLPNTLYLAAQGEFSPDHQLFFVDRQRIADEEQMAFCLTFESSAGANPPPLKVTLHWTDPPASTSATYTLVHNLDLIVKQTGGAEMYGNSLPGVSSTGMAIPLLDSVNNNEQIIWHNPSAGQYTVLVNARDLPFGTQNFSLVVTGAFASAARCDVPGADGAPFCPGTAGQCNGHGTCLPAGVCRCDAQYAGADCQSQNGVLTSDVPTTTPPIVVSGWVFYTFDVSKEDTWQLTAESNDTTLRSDPDLYVAFNRQPSLDDFDAQDVNGPATQRVVILSNDVQVQGGLPADGGTMVVGVYAYCCDTAQVQLTVSIAPITTSTSAPTTSSTAAPTTSSTTAPTTSSSTSNAPTTTSSTTENPTTSSMLLATPGPTSSPTPTDNVVSLRVFVASDFTEFAIDIDLDSTVAEALAIIAASLGLSDSPGTTPAGMYLFFEGTQLQSARTLTSYGVTAGDLLVVGLCADVSVNCTASNTINQPRHCRESDSRRCHATAYCEDYGMFTQCVCPEGSIGDGLAKRYGGSECNRESWALQLTYDLVSPPVTAAGTRLDFWERDRGYLSDLLFLNATEKPSWFDASMYHTVTDERFATIYALFFTREEAEAARQALLNNTLNNPPGNLFGGALPDATTEPSIHTFVSQTSEAELRILPTGMDVENVFFQADCLQSGCWVIDVIWTEGEDNFNVFYIPRAAGNDTLSYDFDYSAVPDYALPYGKSPLDTFLPLNFPCGSDGYNYDRKPGGDIPDQVSACCIEEFTELYRPVDTFLFDTKVQDVLGISRDGFCDVNQTRRIYNTSHMPDSAVHGNFSGMDGLAHIEFREVLDPFVRQYSSRVYLDEVALRQRAGILSGAVGVAHSIDTFIGFANFKPTGLEFLDMFAAQTSIHLERTNFFTVSVYGENEFTFLDYVNLRLICIFDEDEDPVTAYDPYGNRFFRTNRTNAAQYLQVTFTLGEQYQPIETGVVPLDSVLVSKGDFITSRETIDTRFHACSAYEDGTFPKQDTFESRFPTADSQRCAPNATMCYNPPYIPDQFVHFNIPLGVDWLPEPSNSLDSNVFVDLVVSVIDTHQIAVPNSFPNLGAPAEQMKTTLKASIPVVEGGIYKFCDHIIAKQDLNEVAQVDLVLGSAGYDSEFSRLQILKDIGNYGGIPSRNGSYFHTDSIEAGLMTLVVQGNESYFGSANTFSLELEDLITVHFMEHETGTKFERVIDLLYTPGGNDVFDSNSLSIDSFALNGAFSFAINRVDSRASLHPSRELQQLCPFIPQRPNPDDFFPSTCVTRRDIQARNFPNVTGKPATAIELPSAQVPLNDSRRDSVAGFMQLVLNPSEYSAELGRNFSHIIAQRYELNGRFRRAYWINPGYEWTPQQTGNQDIFTLSQTIILFALIGIDEEFTARRRMLLQSVDPTQNSGSGVSGTAVTFETTLQSMLAAHFNVPQQLVATLSVEMQLSFSQACLSLPELRRSLRSTLDDYVGQTTTHYETVQITTLSVDMAGVQCQKASRRLSRSLLSFSPATVSAEVAVVFSPSDYIAINLDELASMVGVISITPLVMSDVIEVSVMEEFVPSTVYRPSPDAPKSPHGTAPTPETEPPQDKDSFSIATIVIAAAAALVVLIGGLVAFKYFRDRAQETETEVVKAYGGMSAELALP